MALTRIKRLLNFQSSKPRRHHRPPIPPPEPDAEPLPSSRSRRLTTIAAADGQMQSHFMSHIPSELRLIIWEYVLAPDDEHDVLHIDLGDNNLKHVRCYEPKPCVKLGFRHICWQTAWTRERRRQRFAGLHEPIENIRKVQSLLLTCKLIYAEAVDLLYRLTIFDFRRSECLIRLPLVILPHRFLDIRNISFSTAFQCPVKPRNGPVRDESVLCSSSYRPPDDITKWTKACEVLASLRQLDNLLITIALWCPNPTIRGVNDVDSIIAILRPLKAVNATRFNVTLTEALTDEARNRLGVLPFQVHQRERPGVGFTSHPDDN